MARDLKLDALYDIAIENGDLQYVEDGAEVAQSWKIRVLWIYGEWYGNLSIGVPWFDKMFKILIGPEAKRQIITDLTRATPGVKSLVSITETHEDHTGFLALRISTDYDTMENLEL